MKRCQLGNAECVQSTQSGHTCSNSRNDRPPYASKLGSQRQEHGIGRRGVAQELISAWLDLKQSWSYSPGIARGECSDVAQPVERNAGRPLFTRGT